MNYQTIIAIILTNSLAFIHVSATYIGQSLALAQSPDTSGLS